MFHTTQHKSVGRFKRNLKGHVGNVNIAVGFVSARIAVISLIILSLKHAPQTAKTDGAEQKIADEHIRQK